MCVHCEYDRVKARVEWFEFLAGCYYPPEEPLLKVLQEWVDRDDAADFALPKTFPPLVELRRDFARLFVGPFEILAPPYGSIYLEGEKTIYGDSTQDVERRYREEGLEVQIKEPPDHVAIELEYLHLLSCREAAALISRDEEKVAVYRDKQADFFDCHLGAWMPLLTQKVVEHAATGFYPHIATTTDLFLKQTAAGFAGQLP